MAEAKKEDAPKDKEASKKDNASEGDVAPVKKSTGKKKLLFVIILLVILAAGGGAGWYFLKAKKATPPVVQITEGGAAEVGEKKEEGKKEKEKPPVFESLEMFTVNLTGDVSADRYLQTSITLKLSNAKLQEVVKAHLPELRSNILLLLSSKRAEDINSVEGKQKLAEEIRLSVNTLLGFSEPGTGILGIFFTSFVIQ